MLAFRAVILAFRRSYLNEKIIKNSKRDIRHIIHLSSQVAVELHARYVDYVVFLALFPSLYLHCLYKSKSSAEAPSSSYVVCVHFWDQRSTIQLVDEEFTWQHQLDTLLLSSVSFLISIGTTISQSYSIVNMKYIQMYRVDIFIQLHIPRRVNQNHFPP